MGSNGNITAKKTIGSAVVWKFMERMGVSVVQLALQLVLARILGPERYGELSLMIIFTNLANVFIQRGFNNALIQNKNVKEDDYSSVFWVTMGIATIIYTILFFAAPGIAVLYKIPVLSDFVLPFRVICLILFPGALNSIQIAKISREMDFRKIFFGNVAGIIISGVVGIIIAVNGGGLWALVAQTLINTSVACIVMYVQTRIKIKMHIDWVRIKSLFSFGWKLLVSGLLDTLYQDIRSLVVGVKYNKATLGFYNKGKQFPQFVINAVNLTVQSVMLPAMSEKQDDKSKVKALMKNSMIISAYAIFPAMAGLAAISTAVISIILGEKWLPAVPYMQIYCFTFAFYPVHSCNLQAINAMGRSDLFLKLEIIKKLYGLVALTIAVLCFDSPIIIAFTGIITTVISCFVNAGPNRKLLDYPYKEQFMDILPSFISSIVMFGAVYALQFLNLNAVLTLILQIIFGVVVYAAISIIFKPVPYKLCVTAIKNRKKKKASI